MALIKEEIHLLSQRSAIIIENDYSAYLFLTKPNCNVIEKDAFAYMRNDPPDEIDWDYLRKHKLPPYISKDYATDKAVIRNPDPNEFYFIWSADGESVALFYRNETIAFIIKNEKIGFSRSVNISSKIVNKWDQNKYEIYFG